jgi:hypothetical protein
VPITTATVPVTTATVPIMTATVPVFMKLKLDRYLFPKILCSEFYGKFDKPFSRMYLVTDGLG